MSYNTQGQYISYNNISNNISKNKITIQTRLTNNGEPFICHDYTKNINIETFNNIPFFPSLIENTNSLEETKSFTASNEPSNINFYASNPLTGFFPSSPSGAGTPKGVSGKSGLMGPPDRSPPRSPLGELWPLGCVSKPAEGWVSLTKSEKIIPENTINIFSQQKCDSSLNIDQKIFNRRKYSKASPDQKYHDNNLS